MKKELAYVAILATCAMACTPRPAVEADYEVVPLPGEISLSADAEPFRLNPKTCIVADSEQLVNARLFAEYVETLTGFTPQISDEAPDKNYIRLCSTLGGDNADAYTLTVATDSIVVNGASDSGTFYGLQTLRKAVPGAGDYDVLYPAGTVSDAPLFAYRGAHFDTSRHYFTPDSVKIFIDMMAMHNMNRFHWHITDDQGWRLEIKSLPRLTEVGAKRPNRLEHCRLRQHTCRRLLYSGRSERYHRLCRRAPYHHYPRNRPSGSYAGGACGISRTRMYRRPV